MADRRKKPGTLPPTPTIPPAHPATEEPGAIAMSQEMVQFFVGHPLMESRRVHFGTDVINSMIAESLLRRGMPADKLVGARWLWVNGCRPELCLILPGIEA